MGWYQNQDNYHRPTFLGASLLTAILCSIYPVMCFQNYSGKHKAKMKRKVQELEERQQEEEEWPSRPHTPQPPPTPASFILESPSEGTSVPRRQTLQVPECGGGGDELDFEWPPSPLLRSRCRSRTPPPPSRVSTTEALSPQFVGGRAGSDADSLNRSPTPDSMRSYQFGQVATNVAAIRTLLSAGSGSATPTNLLPVRSSSWKDSVRESLRESLRDSLREPMPRTPASLNSKDSSTSAQTASTMASKMSNASSFAYALRNRRPDLRLLKKRNRPSQHLTRRASPLKRSHNLRSPSFYQPKVVEDSGVMEATTVNIFQPTQPAKTMTLKLPELHRTASAPMKPLKKAPTFNVPSIVKTLTSPSEPNAVESVDQALSRSTSVQELPSSTVAPAAPTRRPGVPPRQIRFESPKITESSVESSFRPTPLSLKSSGSQSSEAYHTRKHRHHDYLHKQHYHAMTPPEREPSLGGLRSFHHGDSYFSTFPPDAVVSKDFIPVRTPAAIEETTPKRRQSPRLDVDSSPQHQPDPAFVSVDAKVPSDSATASPKARRSSGLFKVFRKNAFNDNVFDDASRNTATPSTQSPTPIFTVSSPEGTVDRRRLSSVVPGQLPIPPYFARSWSRQTQSEDNASPLATIDDETTTTPASDFHVRRRANNRSSSEALSPLSTPRPRARVAKHRHTLENLHDEIEAQSVHTSGVASSVGSEREGVSDHVNVLDFARRRHKSPSSVSPSSMRSVSPSQAASPSSIVELEPTPLQKTNSGFKSFVLGVRRVSIAVVDKLVKDDEESPEARTDARRNSLPRNSLTITKHRPSLRKQFSKSSTSLLRIQRTRSSRMARVKEESEEPTAEELHAARRERLASIDMVVTNFQQTPFTQRYHDTKRAHLHHVRSLVEEGMDDDDMDEGDDIQLGHEHNVPDHLPNSPLCPLHHKHKSGGKAICPLHGRYKKSELGAAVKVGPARSRRMVHYHQPGPLVQTPHQPAPERQRSQPLVRNQIEIVFDTQEQADADKAARASQSMGQVKESRTQSMGSIDGAWHSPAASSGSMHVETKPDEPRAGTVEMCGPIWNMDVFEKLDSRGRKRYRDACGSDRRRRRVRMRRR